MQGPRASGEGAIASFEECLSECDALGVATSTASLRFSAAVLAARFAQLPLLKHLVEGPHSNVILKQTLDCAYCVICEPPAVTYEPHPTHGTCRQATVLLGAVCSGNIDIMKYALSVGAVPEAPPSVGATPESERDEESDSDGPSSVWMRLTHRE